MKTGDPSSARIAAANAILDRGVGPVVSRSAGITAQVTVEDWLDRLDTIRNRGGPLRGVASFFKEVLAWNAPSRSNSENQRFFV